MFPRIVTSSPELFTDFDETLPVFDFIEFANAHGFPTPDVLAQSLNAGYNPMQDKYCTEIVKGGQNSSIKYYRVHSRATSKPEGIIQVPNLSKTEA